MRIERYRITTALAADLRNQSVQFRPRNFQTNVLGHWLDLLIIALPLLRPLRLLRLVALLSFLNRRATAGLRGRIADLTRRGRGDGNTSGDLARR